MTINRLVAAVFVLLSLGNVYSQHRRTKSAQTDIRINKKAPGVNITFLRKGKLIVPSEGEDNERVWFALHNNLRWPLELDMKAVSSPEYGDAALFYDVLSKGQVVSRVVCHVCTHNPLAPGRSLKFSVPREDFVAGDAIRVNFNYAWEHWNDASIGPEPEHYVYFYLSQLSKSPTTERK